MTRLLASGLGLGLFPFGGTLASLSACFPVAVLAFAGCPGRLPLAALAAAASALTLALGGRAEAAFGRKDPPQVVLDEFAGMWLALAIAPAGENLLRTALVLAVFRVLDGAKPLGLRALQRIPGGAGILVDDLAAGALAGAAGLAAALVGGP